MEILRSIILAVVQGLTEFIPVSSSGHLAIADALFDNITDNLKTYIAITHFGTLFSVIWVFWDDIIRLLKSLLTIPSAIKEKSMNDDLKMVVYIVTASIPTAIIGLLFTRVYVDLTANLIIVGAMLLVTGGVLLVSRFIKVDENKAKDASNFGILNALILGTVQGLAVMPGISRSGATISTALILKSDRKFAGRVSFLISLPAVAGAALLEWIEISQDGCPFSTGIINFPMVLAFLLSFIVGLVALKVLLKFVDKGKIHVFSYYCFGIGILSIVLRILGIL
jgi:undecaprenyl-diphosphatase